MKKADGSKKYNTKDLFKNHYVLKQKEDNAPPHFSCPKFVGMTVKLRREVCAELNICKSCLQIKGETHNCHEDAWFLWRDRGCKDHVLRWEKHEPAK